ncbi:guanine deaminase [Polyangium jinanense]|uniref:Guanine deaminase n=1 Tax=Polyangium jinanense TaxID=2829994 RepID=A0A9X3X9C4_9BACT|nr:guanine deaminase [Polyangium jinanense]MDC3958951.1 guanine deaminase [Polyangium jinanense]MDC3962103.1 guanine deaminase [Polyangium jinanense]MDC3986424.1 guanine deaminase [Polyangium jinanense]
MTDLRGKTLAGTFFHAPVLGTLEVLEDALVEIDKAGRIATVIRSGDPRHEGARIAASMAGTLVTLPAGCYVIPGFVDLHIHAPQYPQLGKALHVPLEIWLRHTFPLEARYADAAFARKAYEMLVADLLANGTTTALYFATIHQEATRLLVDICLEKGQRALVGKVAMDNPQECPDFYRDASTEAGLQGTRSLIEYVRTHPANEGGLVHPVVTPRFVPSCTDAMLEGLGVIARECGCHVQTHCSESDWEHGYVLARHGVTDAECLDGFGLLTRQSILAHANLINADDMARIVTRGSGVAHCPLSNAYFSNAAFPLRAALAKGVRVGLGTDISGGPSASMLDACRMAVVTSRMLESGVDPALPPETRGRPSSRIDIRDAFHLATAAGGDALELPVGRFAPGCHFDAVLVDTTAPNGTIRLFEELDEPEDILAKIVYTASRANLAEIWVAGRRVAGAG